MYVDEDRLPNKMLSRQSEVKSQDWNGGLRLPMVVDNKIDERKKDKEPSGKLYDFWYSIKTLREKPKSVQFPKEDQ